MLPEARLEPGSGSEVSIFSSSVRPLLGDLVTCFQDARTAIAGQVTIESRLTRMIGTWCVIAVITTVDRERFSSLSTKIAIFPNIGGRFSCGGGVRQNREINGERVFCS